MGSPKIIVAQFFGSRNLEGKDVATLRIDAGHHMLDRAILAGSVHALKNQKNGPAILRVELFL